MERHKTNIKLLKHTKLLIFNHFDQKWKFHKVQCNTSSLSLFGRFYIYISIYVQSLSCIPLFVIPWTIAHQAPLFMGFPMQEYWSGLTFSSPGYLAKPNDQTCVSCISSWILYHWTTWEALYIYIHICKIYLKNWGLVNLQCWASFRCTTKRFSYTFFSDFFPLFNGVGYSSLCYIVGPCWLSI